MSPAPVVGDCATAIYASVEPLAYDDANRGYALLHVCEALGVMFEDIYDWALDDVVNDRPGWAILVDLDTCPDEALDWLGQFKGARLLSSMSAANKRLLIAGAGRMDRGGPAYSRTLIQAFLTGTKTVYIKERYDHVNNEDNAWHKSIYVYSDEIDSAGQAEVVKLLLDHQLAPAGIVVHFNVVERYEDVILADAPVMYLRLETAPTTPSQALVDDSINANTGNFHGAAANFAVEETFDGGNGMRAASSYITMDASADLVVDDTFSFEFWFRRDLSFNGEVAYGTDSNDANDMRIKLDRGQVMLLKGLGTPVKTSDRHINDEDLHYACVTKNGAGTAAGALIYVDGVPVPATDGVNHSFITSVGVDREVFGAGNGAGMNIGQWRGLLDEVALYDYVLTPAQILAHYQAKLTSEV